MIANSLIFLMGVLVTALAALILAPLFWRKAQSLARREFEATIPISANEIRAEFDRVRAEAAVSVRRGEVLSAEARETAAQAEADRGRIVVEATGLRKQGRQLAQTIEAQDVALAATQASLAEQESENRHLIGELSQARHAAEASQQDLAELERRLRDLGDLAEAQAAELASAQATIERLEARLDPAGQDNPDAGANLPAPSAEARRALAAAAASREASRSGSPRFEAALGRRELPALDPAAEADIRERISDVAARVIRMTALVEGPDSPLAALVGPAGPGAMTSVPGSRPTLADRVRLLAEADRKAAG